MLSGQGSGLIGIVGFLHPALDLQSFGLTLAWMQEVRPGISTPMWYDEGVPNGALSLLYRPLRGPSVKSRELGGC